MSTARVEPFRVGWVNDWACGSPGLHDQYLATRLAFEEAAESGLLERPVELLECQVEGPPFGTCDTVVREWRRLVDEEHCIAMIGPRVTDDALAARPWAERLEVPTLSDCGTLGFPGRWCFETPNGTFADESSLMIRYLEFRGVKSVALFYEDNPIGQEYHGYIPFAASQAGIRIAADIASPTVYDEQTAADYVETLKASGTESIAYMGWGTEGGRRFLAALRADGWDCPKVMNTILPGVTPGIAEYYGFRLDMFEGWAGMEQFCEANPRYLAFLDRFEARYGHRPVESCFAPLGYDQGRVMSLALARAKPGTREGVRAALEKIRMLPAANGGPGCHISFGPWDHRGYKGDYIVTREVRDGRNLLVEMK